MERTQMPTDQLGYAGKHVVVTGCHSGIGLATARLLIEAGAKVHGLDWRESDLPLAAFTQADLRDRSSIERAAKRIADPVDALFNCAGLAPMLPWLDVIKVNFIGMRHLAEAVLESMQPGSAIVSVGSNGGAGWRKRIPDLVEFSATDSFDAAVRWCEQHPAPQANAYGFSKEAIVVWTMQHSATTIARGVRLNCTSPGSVQTPMLEEIEKVVPSDRIDVVSQPIGRRSAPEEQAWVLLMLNSPRASYINGVDLPVDGGFIASRIAAGN
jgi:NAD(P)-dependent dehydrogenase (short-subunit alcohol dehydrogenase family)